MSLASGSLCDLGQSLFLPLVLGLEETTWWIMRKSPVSEVSRCEVPCTCPLADFPDPCSERMHPSLETRVPEWCGAELWQPAFSRE